MAGPELLLSFLAATAVFAYLPGPALLYTAAQTLALGRRAGLHAALGLHLGGYVHVLAASAGLAIIFETLPYAYLALKLIGAAYLIWLGINLWRQAGTGTGLPSLPEPASTPRTLLNSMLVEILNPKTALFFLAFLPQFVDPTASFPVWLQLLLLGTVVNLMFSSADLICVWLAARITTGLRDDRGQVRWLQRAGGTLLVLLGLRLGSS